MSFGWLSDSLRLLAQGSSFCILRKPRSRTPISGFASFSLIVVFFTSLFTSISYFKAGQESIFLQEAYGSVAMLVLALLATSALAANLIQRKSLWLSLASVTFTCISSWTLVLLLWTFDMDLYDVPGSQAARVVFGIVLLCLLRIYSHFMQPRIALRIIAAALVTLTASFWPWQQFLYQPVFMNGNFEDEFTEEYIRPKFDSEAVFSAQSDILQKQLSRIPEQSPGVIDLYAIGVAGDGNERVFRNEIEFLQELLPKRLDANYLPLINTQEKQGDAAIASVANIKTALRDFAKKMDPHEDILLLYLTSHGSKNHEFVLQLGDLPLTQITPERLNRVLNESGIEHQIIVISACYSGGFVEPLRNEHRLILTAARKDRTSFGCGADSDITWFGKAFWADAMNENNDFELAFAQAKREIGKWETESNNIPSEPQISMGKKMRSYLKLWQMQLPENRPKVAFFTAGEPRAGARPMAPPSPDDTPQSR